MTSKLQQLIDAIIIYHAEDIKSIAFKEGAQDELDTLRASLANSSDTPTCDMPKQNLVDSDTLDPGTSVLQNLLDNLQDTYGEEAREAQEELDVLIRMASENGKSDTSDYWLAQARKARLEQERSEVHLTTLRMKIESLESDKSLSPSSPLNPPKLIEAASEALDMISDLRNRLSVATAHAKVAQAQRDHLLGGLSWSEATAANPMVTWQKE